MYWTKTLIPTLKEAPQEAESLSHRLMLRAGLVRMLMSGVYSYLPLGFAALSNIERIVREEMNATGATEVLLPALQPVELWKRTGRDKTLREVMIRFTDRKGREVCLGPTHEEVVTDLVRAYVSSYKQLPLTVYQIQTKFRDEIRPRFGLVRACEFIMKDAYSFDRDEEGLEKSYRAMHAAYIRIFARCGLECFSVDADPGAMGGSVSHEFMVSSPSGEDSILVCSCPGSASPFSEEACGTPCPRCGAALNKEASIEIGHIFKLGTKYSASLEANYLDKNGALRPLIMGCYGIGVSRLISTIIEQNNDAQGIIWPDEISPFDAVILPLDVTKPAIMETAVGIHDELSAKGKKVLLDDRDERAGVKFKDADLIGIPRQIILGKDFLASGTVELKTRRTGEKITDSREAVLARVRKNVSSAVTL